MAKAKSKPKAKAKSKTVAKTMLPEIEDCCDFSHDHSDEYECDSSLDLDINKLVEADNFQLSLALELTQLIIDNASAENRTAEHVVNSFTLASKVVRENSALSAILEK